MRHFVAAIFLGLAHLTPAFAEGDPITNFSSDDVVMNAAIARAKDTLPLFLKHAVDDEGYNLPGANVKVSFPVKVNGIAQNEIIWVSPFRVFDDGSFVGLLANQPHYMGDLNAGDKVEFLMNMVEDWSYWTDNETSYGNFTTRVIAGTWPDKERDDLMAKMADPAVPADWQ